MKPFWLLERGVFDSMNVQYSKVGISSIEELQAELSRNQEAQAQAVARRDRMFSNPRYEYRKEKGIAIIPVQGIMARFYDPVLEWFYGGMTAYVDIDAAIEDANNDPEIQSILLDIDSPGGSAMGAFETADKVYKSEKPVTALVSGMAASGGYLMASQADKIISKHEADLIGSVGVVATFFTFDFVVNVTSTDAPNKAPDPKTEAGIKAIKDELDMIHGLFLERIMRGRELSAEKINKDFGKGGILIARLAKEAGMIDQIGFDSQIETSNESNVNDDAGINRNESFVKGTEKPNGGQKVMDKAKLKAEHPALYAAIMEEGAEAGRIEERKRVSAHLTFIATDSAFVVGAIKEGKPFDSEAQAHYMDAGIKQRIAGDHKAGAAPAVVADGQGGGQGGEPDAALAALDGAIEVAKGEAAAKASGDSFTTSVPDAFRGGKKGGK